MMNQIAFYDTSIDNCNCGQNKLEASNYKIDIPCMHRIAIGAIFHNFPIINLNFSPKYPNLQIEHEFTLDLSLPHQHYDQKMYIIKTKLKFRISLILMNLLIKNNFTLIINQFPPFS